MPWRFQHFSSDAIRSKLPLGGEIIRDLNETPKLRRHPMEELLHSVLEADGPLIYHSDFEEQQRSLDATCRKFRTYLSAQPR